MKYAFKRRNRGLIVCYKVQNKEKVMLRGMPTEVYCTRANTLPLQEVWMVSDVYGKIKRMKVN